MNLKALKAAVIVLAFSPAFCYGQWNMLGTPIDGISEGDKLGSLNSVAVDSDGTTIVVGSSRNSDMGTYFGYAKVLDWNGSQWVQRGATFLGSALLEGTGSAVDISNDGNTVAISSPWGYNSLDYKCGVVNIYDWDGIAWVLRGNTIEGEGSPSPLLQNDVFGLALALSPDGNYIAIGAPQNTQEVGVLQLQGHVRVYHWDGQSWTQVGEDIDGEISLEEFGHSLDISADGSKVAIGGRGFRIWTDGVVTTDGAGIVRTYAWDGTAWNLRDAPMIGTEQGEKLGTAVSLSDDGNIMAVSSPKPFGVTSTTDIFDFNGTDWVMRSTITGINGALAGPSNDLSADGNTLIIGEPWQNFVNGGTRVFNWNGTQWIPENEDFSTLISSPGIIGFGSAVRISPDGNTIVVGAPSEDAVSFDEGRVYVFQNSIVSGSATPEDPYFRCFPNPTSGLLRVNSDAEILSYQIVSIDGRICDSGAGFQTTELKIDFTGLITGVYFLKIQTLQNEQTLKVIKH
jgi:hypothetical protein